MGLAVAGALFIGLILIIAAMNSGAKDDKSSSPQASNSAKENKQQSEDTKSAGLNTPVRDGKFEFTVTKIESGKTQVGSADFGEKAQGEFVFAYITVKNIGDEGQTFSGTDQYLYDGQGRKFEPSTGAMIYTKDSEAFLKTINPGNSVKGIVIFDVPKGTKLKKLELHDSMFSNGVEVTL